ncbi:MAG: hypothetical protein AAF915_15430 [Cyanobacteria bacterium P01_D01_bin.50]
MVREAFPPWYIPDYFGTELLQNWYEKIIVMVRMRSVCNSSVPFIDKSVPNPRTMSEENRTNN